MVLSIVTLGAIAVWDERREFAAALDDFAAEQATLAAETAAVLIAHLQLQAAAANPVSNAFLDSIASTLNARGSTVALFRPPHSTVLVTASGEIVHAPAIEAALTRGARCAFLTHAEASRLRLPSRLAVAGIASADSGAQGMWKIAIVATAFRVRDRELRAIWRLMLGLALSSTLIAGFGLLAQRNQKKELELERSLAVAEAMHTRDERLVRADKLATLGALATGIAHEVSTPLGVIVGRAEQLLPKVLADERATSSVRIIAEQADRISRVVRAFLQLARGGTPSIEKVSPAELVQAAVELVEHRFAKAQVTLTRTLSRDLPRVACDPRLFEQVLVNLLLNAADACREHGRVEISVVADADRVAFCVSDDGEGISAEVARRATEPFFTTKSSSDGTGLGLAIANEIVKHHHGELALQPRPNGPGTCATVQLTAVWEKEHA